VCLQNPTSGQSASPNKATAVILDERRFLETATDVASFVRRVALWRLDGRLKVIDVVAVRTTSEEGSPLGDEGLISS
jgi:hypothetical protein